MGLPSLSQNEGVGREIEPEGLTELASKNRPTYPYQFPRHRIDAGKDGETFEFTMGLVGQTFATQCQL